MSKSKILYSQKGFAKFRKTFGDSISRIISPVSSNVSSARLVRVLRNA
jgi:hypothetical protein